MSTSSEDVQERDPKEQPSSHTPRGGGDISGKGVRMPETDSTDEREREDSDVLTAERE